MIGYYRQNVIMTSITIAFRLGIINIQVSEFGLASGTSIPRVGTGAIPHQNRDIHVLFHAESI